MSSTAALHFLVYVDDVFWDQIVVLPETVLHSCDNHPRIDSKPIEDNEAKRTTRCDDSNEKRLLLQLRCNNSCSVQPNHPKHTVRISVDGYILSQFYKLLRRSEFYRKSVIANLSICRNGKHSESSIICPTVTRLDLSTPKQEVIDFNWNNRIEMILAERSELDHAMSWFSTFGGAFSALGEEFERCADIAGKISMTQMRIATHLGDPLTVARCKLYWALSKIQKGELSLARRIVEAQFRLAKSYLSVDERLVNMCRGIWAKLRYSWQLRAEQRKQAT